MLLIHWPSLFHGLSMKIILQPWVLSILRYDLDFSGRLYVYDMMFIFMSGSKTKSAVGSASASVSGSSCGGGDDAGSEDADGGSFDLVGNSEKLYEH